MDCNNKVLIIYTGGTIGMGKSPLTGALEPLDFNHLLANLPEINDIHATIDVHQAEKPLDSSNITPNDWSALAKVIEREYDHYDGFVILHGTDTMAYSASALSFMFTHLTKPVIFTGSQLPIGMLRTDGKENLLTSLELATMKADGHPLLPEVCIYFGGRLLRGNRATKGNSDGLVAFDSFNFPHLCDVGIDFKFNKHLILKRNWSRHIELHTEMDPNIVVFSVFPGIQENIVRHVLAVPELRGVVMRSFGNGNAPQAPWFINLLKETVERGVAIVNISQCAAGSVAMERYDTGHQLQDAGIISGYDSTVEAAATKLMHLLARYNDTEQIRHYMNCSLAGEISL